MYAQYFWMNRYDIKNGVVQKDPLPFVYTPTNRVIAVGKRSSCRLHITASAHCSRG
jgi:hypothetical protein